MRTQSWNKQTFWRVGNAGDQVVIDVSFASDCLRGWREFSGPIIEKSLLKI